MNGLMYAPIVMHSTGSTGTVTATATVSVTEQLGHRQLQGQ
eukprot:CAMPEP_0182581768 /NCGR_PEP_ID=MMETSP1324-20130603/50891_1 /TAXON_ID=236786 /ORGANISM="Florenciella sp., Strain RCC1587" /LENGTH=40 /DNA_ID= /DNA_START= /DNA_END= /DNA_ORIENTATION=